MAKVKVAWSQPAINQRDAFLRYWRNRNKSDSYPRKVRSELTDIVKTISNNPEAFPETALPSIRVIPRNRFKLYYKKVEVDLILIVAFWGQQDPDKLVNILSKHH